MTTVEVLAIIVVFITGVIVWEFEAERLISLLSVPPEMLISLL